MIINHNLGAINAQRMFQINTFSMDRSMEALSSGMRINKARDDAAGLAVSEKMRSQIRGLMQASRNAQDGISFIQTAEGWLGETTAVLQRIRELSVQAANGIYSDSDRMQIQVEVSQLVEEVDRIAKDAEFNTLSPLRGAFAKSPSAEPTPAADPGKESSTMAADSKGGVYIQIGANIDQGITVYVENMSAYALGLRSSEAEATGASKMDVKVDSVKEANLTIAKLDKALTSVSKQRANLGAYQNRLEHSIRGIDNAVENLQASESKIRDTDMGKQMVDFVKDSILSQASGVMLAQANIRPQIVLRLLG